MHFRLVGGAEMYSRLVGGAEDAFPDGRRQEILHALSCLRQEVLPLSFSDQSVMPLSASDHPEMPLSPSDRRYYL